MDLLLLKISAFLRPLFFIQVGDSNVFEFAAIGIFLMLMIAFTLNSVFKKSLVVSAIDFFIVAFVIWCITVYIIYFDRAYIRDLAKLILPLLTYIIAKNVITDRSQYTKILLLMIVAYTVPVTISAVMTFMGKGLASVNYWTGVPRYAGIYAGTHSFGHNMTFILMLIAIYYTLKKLEDNHIGDISSWIKALFVYLVILAVYCLFMSRVRTAILGLAMFSFAYFFIFNKKILFYGGVVSIVLFILFLPVIIPLLFPDVVMVEEGIGDATQLGSARPEFWMNNLEIFRSLPIDMQLGGTGIGSNIREESDLGIVNSHNDYLDILMQTGIVGFILYVCLQVVFLRAIFNMAGNEKYLYLAAFVAVTIMNIVSNSYIARFGLGQMFYILMSYIELPKATRNDTEVSMNNTLSGPASARE